MGTEEKHRSALHALTGRVSRGLWDNLGKGGAD